MKMRQTEIDIMPQIAAVNEPHLACVLLLDTSGSMEGYPIESLVEAVNTFKMKTSMDEMARKRVDIAIVEFNSHVNIVQEFTPISEMEPVYLEAKGTTRMGEGINVAIDMVKERNRFYADMGTPCFKPWIFMVTDGAPTDNIRKAAERIRDEESRGNFGRIKFFALGVPGADMDMLTSVSRRVLELSNTDFSGIFNWLSESMVAISVSRVGAEAPLTFPLPENARAVPSDW